MTAKLFTSLELGNLQLANRIMVSPMCQYSAIDGKMQPWHQTHLATMALSGAGMLMVEATAVEAAGRITPYCVGLYDDDTESAMRGVLEHVRALSNMPLGLQLAHAGRKASSDAPWNGGKALAAGNGGWQTVAPSALSHAPGEPTPTELDASELVKLKESFRQTTRRACKLGYEVIELHMAHGYLLHQFLSPIANQRTDEYGGSLENRMRYPLEVFEAVLDEVKTHTKKTGNTQPIPLGVRISASDWVENGWDITQSLEFSKQLEQMGCAFIDTSSGGISPKQKINLGPGYQIPFAEKIKHEVNIPVIAVGLITEPAHAEEIIANNQADAVMLARGFLADPRWPWRAAAQLKATVDAPPQYWRCMPTETHNPFSNSRFGTR